MSINKTWSNHNKVLVDKFRRVILNWQFETSDDDCIDTAPLVWQPRSADQQTNIKESAMMNLSMTVVWVSPSLTN